MCPVHVCLQAGNFLAEMRQTSRAQHYMKTLHDRLEKDTYLLGLDSRFSSHTSQRYAAPCHVPCAMLIGACNAIV